MAVKKKTVEAIRTEPTYVCPTCGASDYERRLALPTQDFAGTRPDGKTFTSIRRQYVRCVCGQVGIEIIYG